MSLKKLLAVATAVPFADISSLMEFTSKLSDFVTSNEIKIKGDYEEFDVDDIKIYTSNNKAYYWMTKVTILEEEDWDLVMNVLRTYPKKDTSKFSLTMVSSLLKESPKDRENLYNLYFKFNSILCDFCFSKHKLVPFNDIDVSYYNYRKVTSFPMERTEMEVVDLETMVNFKIII